MQITCGNPGFDALSVGKTTLLETEVRSLAPILGRGKNGVELTPIYQVCAMALLGEIVYGPFWWQRHPHASLEKLGAMARWLT